MAVAYSSNTANSFASSTPWTFAGVTTSGDNRVGVVAVCSQGQAPTGVTWGGSAMSLGKSEGAASTYYASLYYIIAPATASSDVVISFATDALGAAAATCYTGAHQTTPLGDTDSHVPAYGTTTYTVTLTTTAGDMAVDASFSDANDPAIGAGQTAVLTSATRLASYEAAAGATTTMSSTYSATGHGCLAAIVIQQAAAGLSIPVAMHHYSQQ